MKVFAIGDIVGRTGRRAVRELLPQIIKTEKVDFVIANAENAAGGFGLTEGVMEELLDYGIDILTMGNHTWDNKEIFDFIGESDKIIRPYNYPKGTPGVGIQTIEKDEFTLGVINLIGRVYIGNYLSPFRSLDKAIQELKEQVNAIIVDFHAEATAEKEALGWYSDGRVSALVGTHTHIQTADDRILPEGTAYITDLGLTGAVNSILGMNIDEPLERFLTQMPNRFKVAKGDTKLSGLIIEIDDKTAKAISVKRIARVYTVD
ncbi:TIGR00282 family metallophosphoesterase [Orenia marismortui]|uniref:TIGR00282 family metallophosphoesterase n=1 Tax=Orenia marismortui TaxID=46469 RepID=UPI00037C2B8F|nr:TIGR00282 family metallophosphoesterase [Orenia marismortui]